MTRELLKIQNSITLVVTYATMDMSNLYFMICPTFTICPTLGPTYINELFKLKLVRYNLRGSGTNLEQSRFNLEWLHKSFLYKASTLWNKLPVEIRQSNDIYLVSRTFVVSLLTCLNLWSEKVMRNSPPTINRTPRNSYFIYLI